MLPSDRGYRGTPTFLSNVETFAQIGLLAALGPRAYADTGIADEPGTTVLTVTGAVGRPGVIEVPHGTPLSVLLCEVGAAPGAAILLGGYHGSWWTGDPAVNFPMIAIARGSTYESFNRGIDRVNRNGIRDAVPVGAR